MPVVGSSLRCWRRAEHQRGAHGAGSDRTHPDAHGSEITGHRQGHAEDRRLGGAVGDLSGLALHAGDRRGVDDDAALTVVVRLGGGHRRAARRVTLNVPIAFMSMVWTNDVLVVGHVAVAPTVRPPPTPPPATLTTTVRAGRGPRAASMAAATASSSLASPPGADSAASAELLGASSSARPGGRDRRPTTTHAGPDELANGRGAEAAGATRHDSLNDLWISISSFPSASSDERPARDGTPAVHDRGTRYDPKWLHVEPPSRWRLL